jgi:hypothetical protein
MLAEMGIEAGGATEFGRTLGALVWPLAGVHTHVDGEKVLVFARQRAHRAGHRLFRLLLPLVHFRLVVGQLLAGSKSCVVVAVAALEPLNFGITPHTIRPRPFASLCPLPLLPLCLSLGTLCHSTHRASPHHSWS